MPLLHTFKGLHVEDQMASTALVINLHVWRSVLNASWAKGNWIQTEMERKLNTQSKPNRNVGGFLSLILIRCILTN